MLDYSTRSLYSPADIRNISIKAMYTRLGTHIKCKNFEKSLSYYLALKFKPIFAYGDSNLFKKLPKEVETVEEKYNGVIFQVGDGLLEIAGGHIAVKKEVFDEEITSSKVSAMIDVQGIKQLEQLCMEKGIEISVPIKTYPWGSRELVLKDPDGYILVFRELL